jgi:alpha-amylase
MANLVNKPLRSRGFAASPIIYHLLTDRFYNTDPSRAAPHGRPPFSMETGAFHGGTFKGVTLKLREGWFSRLGVNALLISPPYEQIHGWVPGGAGRFRHYAYHGYYALDFTVVEPSYGTADDLRELVECAHSLGIAVMLDVVMNHPGYPDALTMHHFGIAATRPGWESAGPGDAHAHVDHQAASMTQWWGGAWVRGNIAGCMPGGDDDLTMTVNGLPDFRTESQEYVTLPQFLRNKPDTRAVDLPQATVRDYLIAWLCGWVRELGIDGFRCDTARNVELPAWQALKTGATQALLDWKAAHPEQVMNDAPFWMMGEVFDHGIARSAYYDSGFDSLLNFQFQHDLQRPLEQTYECYARTLQAGRHQFVSYVSSQDTALHARSELARTARPPSPEVDGDIFQSTRSPMRWDEVDRLALSYWQRLGQFRARHSALACGRHRQISAEPYAFTRFDPATGDLVVVALDVPAGFTLPVGTTFHEGASLVDAFSGRPLTVRDGAIALFDAPVVLIESIPRSVSLVPQRDNT